MTTLPQAQVKTLIATFALAALAVSAGNANAYVNKSRIHKAYGHVNKSPIQTATTVRPEQFAPLTAKGGPLHDCVHVAFPQCGDNELNDR
jgi:hypothetical protein